MDMENVEILQDHREHEQNGLPDEGFFLADETHGATSFVRSPFIIP